jgi:hypothetical protein
MLYAKLREYWTRKPPRPSTLCSSSILPLRAQAFTSDGNIALQAEQGHTLHPEKELPTGYLCNKESLQQHSETAAFSVPNQF